MVRKTGLLGVVGIVGLFNVLFSISALSTTFMERPFDDAVKDTPTIVRGKVSSNYTDWVTTPTSKSIYTFYQLNIDEVFKGDVHGASLIFREMGGEKDGIGLQIPGAGHFNLGEDVVLLLSNKNSDGTYDLLGLSSGKYNVQRNSDGKETLLGFGVNLASKTDSQDHPGIVHPGEENEGQLGTPDQSKWTIEALRKLTGGQKIQEIPSPTPSKAPQLGALTKPSERAPQLQSSSPAEPLNGGIGNFFRTGLALSLAVGGVALLIALFWLRRK